MRRLVGLGYASEGLDKDIDAVVSPNVSFSADIKPAAQDRDTDSINNNPKPHVAGENMTALHANFGSKIKSNLRKIFCWKDYADEHDATIQDCRVTSTDLNSPITEIVPISNAVAPINVPTICAAAGLAAEDIATHKRQTLDNIALDSTSLDIAEEDTNGISAGCEGKAKPSLKKFLSWRGGHKEECTDAAANQTNGTFVQETYSFSSDLEWEDHYGKPILRKRDFMRLVWRELLQRDCFSHSIEMDEQLVLSKRFHRFRRWKNEKFTRARSPDSPDNCYTSRSPERITLRGRVNPIEKSAEVLELNREHDCNSTPFCNEKVDEKENSMTSSSKKAPKSDETEKKRNDTASDVPRFAPNDSKFSAIEEITKKAGTPASHHGARFFARDRVPQDSGNVARTLFLKESDTPTSRFAPRRTISEKDSRDAAMYLTTSREIEVEIPTRPSSEAIPPGNFFPHDGLQTVKGSYHCESPNLGSSPLSPKLFPSTHVAERISTSRHNNENSVISSVDLCNFIPENDVRSSPYYNSVANPETSARGSLVAPSNFVYDIDMQQNIEAIVSSTQTLRTCGSNQRAYQREPTSSFFVYDVDMNNNIEAIVGTDDVYASPCESADNATVDWHNNEAMSQKRDGLEATGVGSIISSFGSTSVSVVDDNPGSPTRCDTEGKNTSHDQRYHSYDTVIHHAIGTAETTLPEKDKNFDISDLNLESGKHDELNPEVKICNERCKDFGSLFSASKFCANEDDDYTADNNTHGIMPTLLAADIASNNFIDVTAAKKGQSLPTCGVDTMVCNDLRVIIRIYDDDIKSRTSYREDSGTITVPLSGGLDKTRLNVRDSGPARCEPLGVVEKSHTSRGDCRLQARAWRENSPRIGAYRMQTQVHSENDGVINALFTSDADNIMANCNNCPLESVSIFNHALGMKESQISSPNHGSATRDDRATYSSPTYENIVQRILGINVNELRYTSLEEDDDGHNITNDNAGVEAPRNERAMDDEVDDTFDNVVYRETATDLGSNFEDETSEEGGTRVSEPEPETELELELESESELEPESETESGPNLSGQEDETFSFHLTSSFEPRTVPSFVEHLFEKQDNSCDNDLDPDTSETFLNNNGLLTSTSFRQGPVSAPSPPLTPPVDLAVANPTPLSPKQHQFLFDSASPESICFVHWPIVEENLIAKILGDYCPLRFRNNIRFDYDSPEFRVKQYYMTNRALLQEQYRMHRRVVFTPQPGKWFHFEEEKEILESVDDFIRINRCLYPMFKGPRIVQRKHMFRRWKNRGREKLIILEQLLHYWRQDPAYLTELKREKEVRRSTLHPYVEKPERPPLKLVLHKLLDRMTQDMAHKRLGRPPKAGSSVILLKRGPPLGIDYFGYKRQKAEEWVNSILLKF